MGFSRAAAARRGAPFGGWEGEKQRSRQFCTAASWLGWRPLVGLKKGGGSPLAQRELARTVACSQLHCVQVATLHGRDFPGWRPCMRVRGSRDLCSFTLPQAWPASLVRACLHVRLAFACLPACLPALSWPTAGRGFWVGFVLAGASSLDFVSRATGRRVPSMVADGRLGRVAPPASHESKLLPAPAAN